MQTTVRNISIIVVVFSIATFSFILWLIMRRINSILAAIKSVREGEYTYRVNMSGSDELALLGDEFNLLTERLRETDEVRRHFVANASHELKTPLASIRLLSDSILQNVDIKRETVHEFVEDIGTEAERLARTTEKLMTLTRLDSHLPLHHVAVDMRDAVNSTLRRLRPFAGSKNLAIKCELEESCFVMATEDAIDQIVYNLVENAIKYNKPNGKVFVGLVSDDDSIVLTVADTGVGVPDEDMPYIFDRFYRVDKARSRDAGGSGLGLSIVRDTVRELNGTVTAEQLKDGGMVFEVRFVQAVDGDIPPTV
jgi:signal transduction histidine kinase